MFRHRISRHNLDAPNHTLNLGPKNKKILDQPTVCLPSPAIYQQYLDSCYATTLSLKSSRQVYRYADTTAAACKCRATGRAKRLVCGSTSYTQRPLVSSARSARPPITARRGSIIAGDVHMRTHHAGTRQLHHQVKKVRKENVHRSRKGPPTRDSSPPVLWTEQYYAAFLKHLPSTSSLTPQDYLKILGSFLDVLEQTGADAQARIEWIRQDN